ncbi:MAG: hypothetical protein M5U18_06765 [Dehalococcoidia bacterium]|nr:hypothetical protein [Dehalococcoidia bacterium]
MDGHLAEFERFEVDAGFAAPGLDPFDDGAGNLIDLLRQLGGRFGGRRCVHHFGGGRFGRASLAEFADGGIRRGVGDTAGGCAGAGVVRLLTGLAVSLSGADSLAFPTELTTPSVAGAVSPAGGSAASAGAGRADSAGGSGGWTTIPGGSMRASAAGASTGAADPDA